MMCYTPRMNANAITPPKRIGLLTVKSICYDDQNLPSATWWCKCACGKDVVRNTDHLLSTYCKSCGCLKGKASKRAIRSIHAHLAATPLSTRELVHVCDVKRETIVQSLTFMHDNGVVYIARWLSRCNPVWAVQYEWSHFDAARPPRDDVSTRVSRHRARADADRVMAEAANSPLGMWAQLEPK